MRFNENFAARLLGGMLALAVITMTTACKGENLFTVGDGVPTVDDTPGDPTEPTSDAPVVAINIPSGDALAAKPIGDSIFVSTHVTDDVGLATVRFLGVAFRGDPDLGTDEVVPRFGEKSISLPVGTVDTTLTRYLIPNADETKERVHIIVEAEDTDGNFHADTVSLHGFYSFSL